MTELEKLEKKAKLKSAKYNKKYLEFYDLDSRLNSLFASKDEIMKLQRSLIEKAYYDGYFECAKEFQEENERYVKDKITSKSFGTVNNVSKELLGEWNFE